MTADEMRNTRQLTCIYADYQATTPVDPRVLAAMEPYWNQSFGNPHSNDHIVGWRAEEAIRKAASSVAALIGADADEVIFTSGATEANNLALLGLARHSSNRRRRILVSAIEHKCVLASADSLARHAGFSVELVPVDSKGQARLDALEEMLDADVQVVSIMAVNNEIGVIQDIPGIAALLAPHGILLHCDAAQAPCAMDMSAFAEHADLLSLSGHKMYGPQGIGALYIRRGLHDRIEPIIYGGGQQEGLRSGTLPLPLCVGLGAAALLCVGDEAIEERQRVARQRDAFIHLVQSSGRAIELNGPPNRRRHPGNANLRFRGYNAQDILGALQPRLAASTGSACASGTPESSHVLRALGLSTAASEASIRFSFGRFTSEREIELAAELVTQTLDPLASVCMQEAALA